MCTREYSLSDNARTILELIAEGHSYEQILKFNEMFTYLDIFNAASEALKLDALKSPDYHQRLSRIRESHSRAYEKWTHEEDAQLTEMFRAGAKTHHISDELHRQQSAILSRLKKLGLVKA